MHTTKKQHTKDHKIKHIQYTVYPEKTIVAQLNKIQSRDLQNLWFITEFMGMSFNGLLKHEQ